MRLGAVGEACEAEPHLGGDTDQTKPSWVLWVRQSLPVGMGGELGRASLCGGERQLGQSLSVRGQVRQRLSMLDF